MTLHRLLVDKMGDHVSEAMRNVLKDKDKYYEYLGKARMCDELIKLLSEETLKTEVLTKEDAMTRKDTVSKGEISW